MPFSTKVKNLTIFFKSIYGQQYSANPTLSKRLKWAKVTVNIIPYPTIEYLSDWLSKVANLICVVQDVNNAPKYRMLHTT